jgi:hypothetical protein
MGDTTGDGGELTPQLVMEMNRIESSREDYNNLLYQQRRLNNLLKDALKDKGVDKNWIKKSRYIPIEDCTRGSHRATDVLIFNREDFREVPLEFAKPVDIKEYMEGVSGLVDPHQLEIRPIAYPPKSGKTPQQVDILSEGYWGWFSEMTIEEEHKFHMGESHSLKGAEPIAEVWKYEPSISSADGKSYLAFYSKEGSWLKGIENAVDRTIGFGVRGGTAVRVGWVYLPIEQQHAEKFGTLLKNL